MRKLSYGDTNKFILKTPVLPITVKFFTFLPHRHILISYKNRYFLCILIHVVILSSVLYTPYPHVNGRNVFPLQ